MLTGCLDEGGEGEEGDEAPMSKSVAEQVVEFVTKSDGRVFDAELVGQLMAQTAEFKLIAKARSTGTTDRSIYFLTPGGFRCAAKYGDAFRRVFRTVVQQTRELMVAALPGDVSPTVLSAVELWARTDTARAERIFTEAVALHVEAWDDFDLDGRLTGGDDAILDTSSGKVVVRECTFHDHVSYNVGYNIANAISNRTTAEYTEFKTKLLRIIKEPDHRDFLLPIVANVVLNGHVAWLLKLIMVMCGPKDSAKSTLFLYVLSAIGNDYGGNIDFNELTSGQATGSSNDAAMRLYLSLKRFCLIDEGEEEDIDHSKGRKRMLHSRIKSFMSNTPRKSRAAHTLNYTEVAKFPFFCITLNQANMFAKPGNADDLERWLLINATSLASFKAGVVDDDVAHVYTKDPDFVKPETIKKNRLHMLSLLCEYYDAGFDPEAAMPADLRRIRDEWDYKYETPDSPSAAVDGDPPTPYYVVHNKSQTSDEALTEVVEQVTGMCTRAKGKLVTLKVHL